MSWGHFARALVALGIAFALSQGCTADSQPAPAALDGVDASSTPSASPGPTTSSATSSHGSHTHALNIPSSVTTPRAVELAEQLAAHAPAVATILSPNPTAWEGEDHWLVSAGWRSARDKRFDDLGARVGASARDPFEVGLSQIERFRLRFAPEGARDKAAVHHAGRIVYEDAYPSTDEIVVSALDRFEIFLLLKDAGAPHDFAWNLTIPSGLTAQASAGKLDFVDRKGRAVLRIPQPFVIDAAGTRRNAALELAGDHLSIRVDANGLQMPLLLDPAVEQTVWVQVPGLAPSVREFSAMAFDPAAKAAWLTYGSTGVGPVDEIWSFNGSAWSLQTPGCRPQAREEHGFVWETNSATPRGILFGGFTGSAFLGDSWVFDPTQANANNRWKPICGAGNGCFANPGACPFAPVTAPFMAYDSFRKVTVVYGGFGGGNDEMWELNGTTWSKRCGPCGLAPAGQSRSFGQMVFDSVRHRLVLFGGRTNVTIGLSDTWELLDTSTTTVGAWTQVAVAGPGPRLYQAMAYDSARQKTVLHGGDDGLGNLQDDTWEWDGTSWLKMTNVSTGTPRRGSSATFFDNPASPPGRRTLLFGGSTVTSFQFYMNDTWEYYTRGGSGPGRSTGSCSSNADCDTDFCVDGVCCETSSCPRCQNCNLNGNSAITGLVATPGQCFAIQPGSNDTTAPLCQAAADCGAGGGVPCACDGTGSLTSCKIGVGGACITSASCASGACVDGFCCNTACNNGCEVCSIVKGASANGTCANAPASSLGNPGCNGFVCTGASPTCPNVCNVDADCAPTHFCTGTKTCAQKRVNGLACGCAAGACSQCFSGNCADGVCCDSQCTGSSCVACTNAKKGAGIDGACGPIAAGLTPNAANGTCSTQAVSTCGTNGKCDGAGNCQKYSAGLSCGSASCTGNSPVLKNCDGFGVCQSYTQPACTSGGCNSATGSCKASCATDADCVAGDYCSSAGGGTCAPQKVLGGFCNLAADCKVAGTCAECVSGNCADGVCCDQACSGACQACTAAKKGSGADGACAPIATGLAPNASNGSCTTQATSTCGTDGKCDGSGSCRKYGAGTSCASGTCSGNTPQLHQCDGFGACQSYTQPACTAGGCNSATGSCRVSCAADSDCVPGDYCSSASGGTCQPKVLQGGSCNLAADCKVAGTCGECVSGNCVDGVCCDQGCSGACQACTTAKKGSGADGVCGPIGSGQSPNASNGTCTVQATTTCGTDGKCDGTGSCRKYATGTGCGSASCSGTSPQLHQCDGLGTCQTYTQPACTSGGCNAATGACKTTCATDADCVSGYFCSSAGGGTCAPQRTLGLGCSLTADCKVAGSCSECVSGNCIDGVCCDQGCSGACQACTAAKKGGGSNGACGPIAAGMTPNVSNGTCTTQTALSCGTDGTCDGSGACRKYGLGTSCGTASCSGNTPQQHLCDGFGACQASNQSVCSAGACNPATGTCRTTCASDADCVPGDYCGAGKTCLPQKAQGQACSASLCSGGACHECASGSCADGVCCDQACGGTCQACSAAKKGSGADGVCGNVASQSDPDNECADDGQNSCQHNGSCNGTGACAFYANGISCGSSTCSGNTAYGNLCNGLGACQSTLSQGTDCTPYLCIGGGCTQSCQADADCAAQGVSDAGAPLSFFCKNNQCIGKQGNGQTCADSNQCQSGFCVEGLCCDTACNGTCQTCTGANQANGNPDGKCGNAKVGVDPQNSCTAADVSTCGLDGECNGAGACELWANGTKCGDTTCDTSAGKNEQHGAACDGNGSCNPDAVVQCNEYACKSSACLTTCATGDDCTTGFYCDGVSQTCTKKIDKGQPCSDGATCSTNYCVDGVCCESACSGQCEACNIAAAPGTCTPVVGQPPVAPRDACPSGGALGTPDACQARICDGNVSRTDCQGYVGSNVSCRSSGCENGIETFSAACDSRGHCGTDTGVDAGSATKVCEPFACDTLTCKLACASDNDCKMGYKCDTATGKCVSGATCRDEHTVKSSTGETSDCTPFKCDPASGACFPSCASVNDCIAPSVCNPVGRCVPAPSSSASSNGGCGCVLPGHGSRGASHESGALLALALGLVVARRRRRAG